MATVTRYRCPGCGYVYDERQGDPHEGFAPGTPWSQVPDDWACPDCAVREKPDFQAFTPTAVAREQNGDDAVR
jgi:rubredoxin